MSESLITKKALAASLRELMTSLPFEKVSVGDICEHCGMSRKSFYYHFRDKYDLVNWIFNVEFLTAAQSKAYADAWEFLSDICGYFYDNKEFYISALQVEGQNSFTEYFYDVFQPVVSEYLKDEFSDPEHSDFYATFFIDGMRVALIRWLKDNAKIEPDVFVALFRRAVGGIAKKYGEDAAQEP
ncbi:MAG: TetR/AcrR family transcriptional regulator C-terminal domain-containing protein [Oscillospiraceae bacterium]|nr:TetR/AcrR family transcriptional regulator C-terminal domain-containing protein [Oscillospiraceae bacterium]